MSRLVHLVRHEKSYGSRLNRRQFGPEGAGLTPDGAVDSKAIPGILHELGVDLSAPVASSTKLRAVQTAQYAGFTDIRCYPLLDEIDSKLDPTELASLLEQGRLPAEAAYAGMALLETPPRETVWFTHGQLIRAVGNVLGAPHTGPFIPPLGSVTTFTISG